MHAVDDAIVESKKARAQAKDRLAHLRKDRRAAARQQQAIAASAGATEESIARVREEVEILVVATKKAKASLKTLATKVASSEGKLRKRRHRRTTSRTARLEREELVQELTDAIGHTRDKLDDVVAGITEGKKGLKPSDRAKEADSSPLAQSQQRDEYRATLIPLTAEVEHQAEAVAEKVSAFEDLTDDLDKAKDALRRGDDRPT